MTFLRPKSLPAVSIVLALFVVFAPRIAADPATAQKSDLICSFVISGGSDGITENVPVTFAAIFAKGDVPAGNSVRATDSSDKPIPLQVDVKARHPDGSLRHAVLTINIPHLAHGQNFIVHAYRGPTSSTEPLLLTELPEGFDVEVTLTLKAGTVLKVSAKDFVNSGKPELWLSGSQVTEWWFNGAFRDASGNIDPHLTAWLGLRSYGKNRPLRVELDIENTWTWIKAPRTEYYDARIIANGRPIFNQIEMAQQAHTRWRKVFWWSEPVSAFVEQPLDYLKRARVVPNYDPDTKISVVDLANYYALFESRDRRPLETGLITHYMPTTGGRGDIGPFPKWAVYYLLTMDRRAYEMMLAGGDLAGSYMSHYRNERTGRPVTTEDYPSISTHSNFVGKPGNLEIPDTGGHTWDIVADASHQPSLAFLPYLVTGDRYYLEELQFWSQFNAWGTAPETHGFGKSLVTWDQVRGQAWALRTLAQAAFITPDNDPLKAVLNRELSASLDFYNQTFVHNPHANVFHADFYRASPDREYSPWMDDFLTWSIGYVAELGFEEARPFARWKGYYPVQRMINPDYCWVLASSYRMIFEREDLSIVSTWREAYQLTLAFSEKRKVDPSSLKCGSDEMALSLNLHPGEMNAFGPGGYVANLQPALAEAVDFGVPGAQEAWAKFRAQRNPTEPEWAILPWTTF